MALPQRREELIFRDAHLIYKNFAGLPQKYNKEGDRNFSVMIGQADGEKMLRDGWNVKPMKMRDEDPEQFYHLKVAVSFANRPPRCWLISSNGRTMIGDGLIGMFDQVEFQKVDLTVSAFDWKLETGASGRKAYLQTFFGTMYEDELELEYAHVPQLGAAGDSPPQLEAGEPVARRQYDFEGDVVE